MSIREIHTKYQLAQARGHLPDDANTMQMTIATALAAGSAAFHQAYFGNKEWAKAMNDARTAAHERGELVGNLIDEALTQDIQPALRRMGAVHTSSDFPLALSQIRDRVRRRTFDPTPSNLLQFARRRTATDFKRLRSIRQNPFISIPKRPEGTNVEYAEMGSTEDGYALANYELAVALTWEAWVNDDLDEFTTSLASLGIAASRTRGLVLINAIKSETRQTPSGTNAEGTAAAGGPTRANIVWAYQTLAEKTNSDSQPVPRLLSHVAVPAVQATTARQALNSEMVNEVGDVESRFSTRNAAFGMAELLVEPEMAVENPGSTAAGDWIAFDGRQEWLEFATLRGYEAGPKTFTRMPNVVETDMEGSFENKSIAVKVSDNIAAKVTDSDSVLLVASA